MFFSALLHHFLITSRINEEFKNIKIKIKISNLRQ